MNQPKPKVTMSFEEAMARAQMRKSPSLDRSSSNISRSKPVVTKNNNFANQIISTPNRSAINSQVQSNVHSQKSTPRYTPNHTPVSSVKPSRSQSACSTPKSISSRISFNSQIDNDVPVQMQLNSNHSTPKVQSKSSTPSHISTISNNSNISDRSAEKCICQMCICNNHHCPKLVHRLPFEGESVYHHDYHELPLNMERVKHRDERLKSLPFEGQTTYEHDYVAKELPKRENKAIKTERKTLKFEGETTYKAEYPLYDNYSPPTKHRQVYTPNTAKFEVQHDYTEKELPKRENKIIPTERKTLKFEGETIYNTDYVAHECLPRQRRIHEKAQSLPEDRDFLSVTQKDFTKKEIKVCPCIYLPKPPNYDEDPKAWKDDHVYYNLKKKDWVK